MFKRFDALLALAVSSMAPAQPSTPFQYDHCGGPGSASTSTVSSRNDAAGASLPAC